jgi:hypothetical protein
MGVNLQRILGELPADVLPLFRSVTAVVIASDVRPAHYDPNTGAIYLDPDFLWLTVAERNTVSTAPDPRSNFGIELQFAMPWRFVRANEPLTIYLNADGSRDLEQIVDIMAYLLYHELAHATDFMPPGRQAALPGHLTVLQALNQQPPLSSQFVAVYPLQSATLRDLAAVSFLGETATPAQRALQPADLVDEFANDGALQYYAYTTQFEDFASLFDTAMMNWHFGYDKDTAITDRPASGDTADAIVAWGERGRLGAQQVNARAVDVGQRIYPGDLSAFEGFLLGLPAPTPMRAGETWQQNLDLQAPPATTQQRGETGIERRTADYFLERVRIR